MSREPESARQVRIASTIFVLALLTACAPLLSPPNTRAQPTSHHLAPTPEIYAENVTIATDNRHCEQTISVNEGASATIVSLTMHRELGAVLSIAHTYANQKVQFLSHHDSSAVVLLYLESGLPISVTPAAANYWIPPSSRSRIFNHVVLLIPDEINQLVEAPIDLRVTFHGSLGSGSFIIPRRVFQHFALDWNVLCSSFEPSDFRFF